VRRSSDWLDVLLYCDKKQGLACYALTLAVHSPISVCQCTVTCDFVKEYHTPSRHKQLVALTAGLRPARQVRRSRQHVDTFPVSITLLPIVPPITCCACRRSVGPRYLLPALPGRLHPARHAPAGSTPGPCCVACQRGGWTQHGAQHAAAGAAGEALTGTRCCSGGRAAGCCVEQQQQQP